MSARSRESLPQGRPARSLGTTEKIRDGRMHARGIMDLHEASEYAVRGKKGMSGRWLPPQGLRQGCPTSSTLFNLYHQAVMRVADRRRGEKAEEMNRAAGIDVSWVPGCIMVHRKRARQDRTTRV